MTTQEPSQLEGLQLWIPEDNFQADYNIAHISHTMADLQAVNVLHVPGSSPIYVGGENRVIYHAVNDEAVQDRARALGKSATAVTSCLEPNRLILPAEYAEEARVRELHTGLGRTSIFLAVAAETSDDFMKAANDLKETFLMLNQPIHDVEAFSKTSQHASGLIYMFVKAARKYKTLTREDATDLADAIDRGMMPMRALADKNKFEPWMQARGRGFIERSGFVQKRPPRPRKAGRKKKIDEAALLKEAYTLMEEKERSHAEKKEPTLKSRAEVFISRLYDDKRRVPYEVKLATAHTVLVQEQSQEFTIRNNTKLETAKLGMEAYLLSIALRRNPTAEQVLKYVTHKKSNYRTGLLPFMVVGNVLTAKVNANGGFKDGPHELPGLTPSRISEGFKAVRYAINNDPASAGERKTDRMLGDILEAYLAAAFEDVGPEAYADAPKAPEGVTPLTQFVLTLRGTSESTVDKILAQNGIDIFNYKFGSHVRKGISEDEKKLVLEVLQETRPEPAPTGTVSVTTYCHVRGLNRKVVDQVIRKNDVEVGRHLFRSKPGRSLSAEAQKQLDDIIYE